MVKFAMKWLGLRLAKGAAKKAFHGAGDERQFTAEIQFGAHAGTTATFHVTVTAVKEKESPALDDAFAAMASEFETIAELRDDVRNRMQRIRRLPQPVIAQVNGPAAGGGLALVLASQALRWWCIATLGRRWNTRVIVVPGLAQVTRGPYRLLRHPNYVAVVVEGVALPLVHAAWITALVFTLANAGLLAIRIRCEDRALASLPRQESGAESSGGSGQVSRA